MRPRGDERAGNMNALWDRWDKIAKKIVPCRKDVLPKSEVESHIFETFRGKFTYRGSLGHICRQLDTIDFPFVL